jgi:FeS assembly SUF system protein
MTQPNDMLEGTPLIAPSSTDHPLHEAVVEACRTVYDPEIPVDIYELGLIYEVNVYPVNNVYILMTLTSPSCPAAEEIPSEVEMKVRAIEGVSDVKVELTFDPPYSQEMMSEAAKLELGFM